MQFSRILALAALVAVASPLYSQEEPKAKPEDTEVWGPVPKVVTPGANNTAAPSDAMNG